MRTHNLLLVLLDEMEKYSLHKFLWIMNMYLLLGHSFVSWRRDIVDIFSISDIGAEGLCHCCSTHRYRNIGGRFPASVKSSPASEAARGVSPLENWRQQVEKSDSNSQPPCKRDSPFNCATIRSGFDTKDGKRSFDCETGSCYIGKAYIHSMSRSIIDSFSVKSILRLNSIRKFALRTIITWKDLGWTKFAKSQKF